jgi:hypothetical protein
VVVLIYLTGMGVTTTATPTGRLTMTAGKGTRSTLLLVETRVVPPSDSRESYLIII